MNEKDFFLDVEVVSKTSPPMSHLTVTFKENVLRDSLELGRIEFPHGSSLDYISRYSNHKLDMLKLGSWVDFKNGYRFRVPGADDLMWVMLEFVSGKSLKKLLESGFLKEMDKAIMMLIQKSVFGAVDKPRVGENPSSQSVSIEFLSDVTHILEEYKADEDSIPPSKLEEECETLRGKQKKMVIEQGVMRDRVTELSKANSSYRAEISELEVANRNLEKGMEEIGVKVKGLEKSLSDEQKGRRDLEAELSDFCEKYQALEKENTSLKLEMDKGVEDIAKALRDGYGRYYRRMQSAGLDVSEHCFENYLQDYAAANKEQEQVDDEPNDP
ncbi:uncharacterized protein LOC141714411 [Apium graveolens]|uniref:uncharacterized protein LOC141714411 n=1 Tax=Apium graveolens TaxID=4045 RepID=UPI003D78C480